MKFSTSTLATSLLVLSSVATAIPTTDAGRALKPRETSLADNGIHSRAAEPLSTFNGNDDLIKRAAAASPIDPELAEALKHTTKEFQKPGIGQGPTLGVDPGITSGLIITSLVIFFYGSLIWFTTEEDQCQRTSKKAL